MDAFGPLDSPQVENVEKLQALEEELAQTKECLEQLQKTSEDREEEFAKETEAFDKMTKNFRDKINEMQTEIDMKEERVLALQEHLNSIRDAEAQKHSENEGMKSMLDEIKEKYEAKVKGLEQTLEDAKEKLDIAEENFRKSQLCVKGLADANVSQVINY